MAADLCYTVRQRIIYLVYYVLSVYTYLHTCVYMHVHYTVVTCAYT